eukprot:scaffold348489_cov28-Prasinocladus_malaysianus.AAC.4
MYRWKVGNGGMQFTLDSPRLRPTHAHPACLYVDSIDATRAGKLLVPGTVRYGTGTEAHQSGRKLNDSIIALCLKSAYEYEY